MEMDLKSLFLEGFAKNYSSMSFCEDNPGCMNIKFFKKEKINLI